MLTRAQILRPIQLSLLLCIGFFISIRGYAQPANDLVCNAITLSSAPSCSNTAGTLVSSTYTIISPIGCGIASRNDVWYMFVAKTTNPTITLSSTPLNPRLQLFSGACGSITSVACGTNTLAATGLTIGNTYFIRVYTDPNASGTFNICITDPAPSNNLCGTPIVLTSSTSCVNTSGNMYASTLTAMTVTAPDCATGETYDVWYSFVAQTINPTITLSNVGSSLSSVVGMQLLSNNCGGTFTSFYCGTTSIAANFLVPGTTYFVRVYGTGALPTTSTGYEYDICITDPVASPPFNDDCSNATNLPIWNTCNNVPGTMAGATVSTPGLGGSCTGPLAYDTWFKFTSLTTTATITLSSIGANFLNPRIELLSGSCGSLTSVACGTSPLNAAGLTAGNTYYVRVYSTSSPAPNGNANFNICATTSGAPVRFGNTYVNVTKKTTGGVVEPNDILEIRMTISHTSGTKYYMRFVDNIPSNTVIAPGGAGNDSIWIKTNEGLTYKRYTLTAGDDAGTYAGSPPLGSYNIRLNLGFGGTNPGIPVNTTSTEVASITGRMVSTDRPRGGGGLLFAIAYRVRVTGNVGDTITLNPGRFIYKGQNLVGSPDTTLIGTAYKIVISDPESLCANATGVNIASEFGGTFGSGTTLNRSTDLSFPIDRYTFIPNVSSSAAINDGRYGIVKNISPRSGTLRNARRTPNCGTGLAPTDELHCNFRMFNGFWYIDGDHSGTSNSTGNNPPAATTNSGYMLLVNADYVASEVYRQTINNLCPNTYYEFSAWLRNVCPTCGIDSAGVSQYNPGVYPNLAFLLNDVDYYNTGEIDTTGWLKKGFVFKTGPSQTSATFSIRNNSQGGGGNDWALDDISVATCLPNMSYSPSLNPTICDSTSITIYDTIRSYFDNYTYYKWQRSTDGGSNWTDVAGPFGPVTPVWNGSAWEYITSYTIPPAYTNPWNTGDKYRVIVGTTLSNLSDPNCQVTDGVSIITVNIIDCQIPLSVQLISFNGKVENGHGKLSWVVSEESEIIEYVIEKSNDGVNFNPIGTVLGQGSANTVTYSYLDPAIISGKAWYRIVINDPTSTKKYTRIILLSTNKTEFDLVNVITPFDSQLQFNISSSSDSRIEVMLTDMFGKMVRKKNFMAYSGVNGFELDNTATLQPGIYILQVRNKDVVLSRKVLKK